MAFVGRILYVYLHKFSVWIHLVKGQSTNHGHYRVLQCGCQQIFGSMYSTEENGLTKVIDNSTVN